MEGRFHTITLEDRNLPAIAEKRVLRFRNDDRLVKRRLFHVDKWQVLQALFQARAVDRRLTCYPWLGDQLLEQSDRNGWPAAPGGFLDLETAWSFLLDRVLDLGKTVPDLATLLEWSMVPEHVARFQALPAEFREGMMAWLCEVGDPARTTPLPAAWGMRWKARPRGVRSACGTDQCVGGNIRGVRHLGWGVGLP